MATERRSKQERRGSDAVSPEGSGSTKRSFHKVALLTAAVLDLGSLELGNLGLVTALGQVQGVLQPSQKTSPSAHRNAQGKRRQRSF